MNPEITVPWSHYCDLVNAADKLAWLELFGVDNWEGYDEAMQALETYYDEEGSIDSE